MKMGFLTTGIFWGIIFLIFGATIILKALFNINIPLFRLFIAFVFIWIGIRILIGGPVFRSSRGGVIFGEARIDASETKNYKDELNTVFGKSIIDLTKNSISDETIKINVIFGYSKIKVNKDLPLMIKLDSAVAGAKLPDGTETSFGNYVYKTKSYEEDKPYLKVKVDVVFGAVDIAEY